MHSTSYILHFSSSSRISSRRANAQGRARATEGSSGKRHRGIDPEWTTCSSLWPDVMDGIRTWSSFETQQRRGKGEGGPSSGDAPSSVSRGVDALYVSSSSPDIAPAAASLLRHSGLTVPAGPRGSGESQGEGDGDSQRNDEEEFRLRFHWMRPHPSLAFALEHEMGMGSGADKSGGIESEMSKQPRGQDAPKKQLNPAVEASKLMEAYRYSQVKKLMDATTNSLGNDPGDVEDADMRVEESGRGSNPGSLGNAEAKASIPDLPLELPKLRIKLANLVEPPLMSSWLPGEDMGISCDSDDER